MFAAENFTRPLPHPLPLTRDTALFLFAVRRLGAHGLADAQLANHFVSAFGSGFQRPLITLRVMMTEIASVASTPILIAPCCCMRMTASEATLIEVMRRLSGQPLAARALLADLLGNRCVDGVLATMALVESAFADAGRRIRG